MSIKIPFGFPERESLVLSLDFSSQSDDCLEWIATRSSIQAGRFRGEIDLYLMAEDLIDFSQQIEVLYRTLNGEAILETVEGQISLHLLGDGKGHIQLNGSLIDRCGEGNKLDFVLNYDQTLLWETLTALRKAVDLIKSKGNSTFKSSPR